MLNKSKYKIVLNPKRLKIANTFVIDRLYLQNAAKVVFEAYSKHENTTSIKEFKTVKCEKYADEQGPFIINSYKTFNTKKLITKNNKKIVQEEPCSITTIEGFVDNEEDQPIYLNIQKTDLSIKTFYEGFYRDSNGHFVDFNSHVGMNSYQNSLVVNALLKMFNKRREYDKEKQEKQNDGETL